MRSAELSRSLIPHTVISGNIMKRVLILLLLSGAALFVSTTIVFAQEAAYPSKAEPPKPAAISSAPTSENVSAKIREYQENLNKTDELLIKRTAERDSYKTAFMQLIRSRGITTQEIVSHLSESSSKYEQYPWFSNARAAWINWKDVETDIVVFSRQRNRLEKSLSELNLALTKLKRNEENKKVYISGEDPELDRLMATAQIDLKLEDYKKNLTSAERALINDEVYKSMTGAVEKTVSKIPGLKLTSIDKLPALPDMASFVNAPVDPIQRSLFNRVKKDFNKTVAAAQEKAVEYLDNRQPEAACEFWLQTIDELKNLVKDASDSFEPLFFDRYVDALNTCRNLTLIEMCKPYAQTLIRCVKNLDTDDDPDWVTIADSLEGFYRIKPDLSLASVKTLDVQLKTIRIHLNYLVKRDMEAKVIQQRLDTIMELWEKEVKSVKMEAEIRIRKEKIRQFLTNGKSAGERKTIKINGVEFAFRWCPPGTFMMGYSKGKEEIEDISLTILKAIWGKGETTIEVDYKSEKQHTVILTKGFWIMETEVTQKQWKVIMENIPSGSSKDDNFPVVDVSWNDCQEFCRRTGFQLPTEAQWEYACRAGSTTAYFWGNALNGDKANCDGYFPYGTTIKGKSLGKTPVGSYQSNAWGLYDMHGNVWEWCQDWYGDYPSGSVTDPAGPSNGSSRVIRGGCFNFSAWYCRSACRACLSSDQYEVCIPMVAGANRNLGFRVVKAQ